MATHFPFFGAFLVTLAVWKPAQWFCIKIMIDRLFFASLIVTFFDAINLSVSTVKKEANPNGLLHSIKFEQFQV